MKVISLTDEQSGLFLSFIETNLKQYYQTDFWDGYRCRFCNGTDGSTAAQAGRVEHQSDCFGLAIKSQLEAKPPINTETK